MEKRTIVLAADHGGFELKENLKKYLEEQKNKYNVVDLGTNNPNSVSYACKGQELANYLLKNNQDESMIGLGFCGTGIGISIAVNRFKHIRGARVCTEEDARLAKVHNNANVLLLGGRQLSTEQAIKIFDTFMANEFEGQRHKERIEQLDQC